MEINLAVLIYPWERDDDAITSAYKELWPEVELLKSEHVVTNREYEGAYLAHRLLLTAFDHHLGDAMNNISGEFQTHIKLRSSKINYLLQTMSVYPDELSQMNAVRESQNTATLTQALGIRSPGAEWTGREMAD